MSNIPKPPKDKRTRAYKEWKAKYDAAPDGLGDVIESFTKATGIKKAVKAISYSLDVDCGCDDRKERINKMLRFKPLDCFNQQEFDFLTQFYNEKTGKFKEAGSIGSEDVKRLVEIHNRVSPRKTTFKGTCTSCFINSVFKPLSDMYIQYL